ncbi:MAG: hypothetical protein ACKOC8_09045 [Pirellulales bacterium]
MSGNIACSCGYRGPGITEGASLVCPICRAPAASEARTYRIPCPNGHVFKVPESWLGREMICTTCNEPFVPQAIHDLEYRKEQERRQAAADAKQAQIWLRRAIAAGVIVALSFIAMIVASLNPQWFQAK